MANSPAKPGQHPTRRQFLRTTAVADVYPLSVTVAGAPKAGTGFFATRERFYLVVSTAPPPIIKSADFDSDGDVDLDDFAFLQARFHQPNPAPGDVDWNDADLDDDGEVNVDDFLVLQQCFNGPNRAPMTGCAP